MEIKRLMKDFGWLPFKVINPKTCEIMGLEHGSIHLGNYDISRGRIDLLRGQEEGFKVYMSLTEDSCIPMNAGDPEKFSILTKMYAVAIFKRNYEHPDKKQNAFFLKSYSKNLGISVPTLKNWIKKFS